MWRVLAIGGVWGLAAYGALCLNQLPLGHSLCGPWGCGPPTAALLAIHAFWLVTTLAVVAVLRVSFPNWNWLRIGLGISATALLLVLVTGVWDFFTWRPDPWNPEGMYLWQRFLYRLATLPDFPILQLAVAGALLMVLPHGRRKEAETLDGIQSEAKAVTGPVGR